MGSTCIVAAASLPALN
ncbi:MAG: hypothetical protein ACXWNH_16205 [Vulcanimicrobiaceae bacterium]